MTKIQEFNLQYGLNVSTNSFAKVERQDTTNDLAGKPKKNIIEIFKRFFTNPVAVGALIVFVVIVLLSIILPLVSQYGSETPIMQGGANSDSFKNLPKNGQAITVLADQALIKRLDNYNIPYQIIDIKGFDSTKVIGRTVIDYKPWELANAIDKFNHNSIIGTNKNAVDIWTRTWAGTANSLKLAIIVAVITTVVGVILGSWIGLYVGSWLDIIIMRVVAAYSSIPTIVWYVMILAILPPGFIAEIVVFAVTGWIGIFSISRLYIWKYVNADFMKAAKTLGVSKFGRIFKHALPNYIGIIAYSFVIMIPGVIEGEATLGFVGFSPNPDGASLGNVLNEMGEAISGEAVNELYIILPVLLIAACTMSLKFVAIGINDAVEPKYARR